MKSIEQLKSGIEKGQLLALSRSITLLESQKTEDKEQALELISSFPPSDKSIRIGISGVPGAGKSTFIESIGQYALEQGKKVAVLAIDPSSQITGGSILGDKTRMEELSRHKNAFIRPSPNSGYLGGISEMTYETIELCELAGYDIILIETVGVGQSEIQVKEMCDVFILLTVAGTGDELQGIKKGIMETANIIFINKVEDEKDRKIIDTYSDLVRALKLTPGNALNWKVPILKGSALNHIGIDKCWDVIYKYIETSKHKGFFKENRQSQKQKRLRFWLDFFLINQLKKTQSYIGLKQDIENGKIIDIKNLTSKIL